MQQKFTSFVHKTPLNYINMVQSRLWTNLKGFQKSQYDTNQGVISLKEKQSYQQRDSSKFDYLTMAVLPFIAIIQQKIKDAECFFGQSNVKRNQMEGRVAIYQYRANTPIEDRYACNQLNNLNGFFVSVFDGHGGWQMAEFAMLNLAHQVDKALKNIQREQSNQQIQELVIKSIEQGYDNVENEFLSMARQAYKMGFSSTGRVGSCALSVLVHDNTVYAANIGDCKGVIVTQDQSTNEFKCTKLNHKQNASSKKEQARLRNQFKQESDIVVCRKDDSKACYVKNMLQPTRSFGDFRLKYDEFNNPRGYTFEQQYPHRIKNFTGPYITHKPEIKVFEMNKQDRYIVLASDGLWDELTKDDVAQIVKKNDGNKVKIVENLFKSAIAHAAKDNRMSVQEMENLNPNIRRSYHDDITVIVIDLQNQIN